MLILLSSFFYSTIFLRSGVFYFLLSQLSNFLINRVKFSKYLLYDTTNNFFLISILILFVVRSVFCQLNRKYIGTSSIFCLFAIQITGIFNILFLFLIFVCLIFLHTLVGKFYFYLHSRSCKLATSCLAFRQDPPYFLATHDPTAFIPNFLPPTFMGNSVRIISRIQHLLRITTEFTVILSRLSLIPKFKLKTSVKITNFL